MSNFDVNCLLGHWPFRKIRKNTLKALTEIHSETGISGGYAASMNSIFYNDPFEGDEELHEVIKGTAYVHILSVNPTLPAFAADIQKGLERFNIKGVRIYPGYHQYKLNHPNMQKLCEVLRKYNLPLFVSVRMEDERINYLMQPVAPTKSELEAFMDSYPDNRIVLLTLRAAELGAMSSTIIRHGNVFFDTSGLKDGLFVIEKLLKTFPAERILYGSMHPLFSLKSTLLLVEKAEVNDEAKDTILSARGLRG